MKKYLFILGIILSGTSTVYAAEPNPFRSKQVGSNPVNGYYLQTNGTESVWAAVSGGSLSGGTAGMLTAWTSASAVTATGTPTVGAIYATSTTATSSFAGPLTIQSWPIASSTVTVCKDSRMCKYTTIQAALNAGWTNIFVKNGVYSEQVTLQTAKTIIQGESLNAIIQCNGNTQSPCVDTNSLDEIKLRDFTIRETNGQLVGVGFDFSNSSAGRFDNIRVNNFSTSTTGIDTTSNTFYNVFDKLYAYRPRSCVELGGTQANKNDFNSLRCIPMSVGGQGLYIVDARGVTFNAANVEATSTAGGTIGAYVASTSREITFINPWFEANGTGLYIESGANRVNVFGGSITSNGTDITDNGTNSQFSGVNKTGTLKNYILGSLGIGTTTPYAKLSVAGNAVVTDNLTSSYFTATSTTATSTIRGGLDLPSRDCALSTNGTCNILNGTWEREGAVNFYPLTALGRAGEVTVIQGTGELLTGTVLKMWFTCQTSAGYGICYGESNDNGNLFYTATSTPTARVLADYNRSYVIYTGGTYYLYGAQISDNNEGIDLLTSADGISWTLSQADVIPPGGVSDWDRGAFGNNFVWIEDTTWYMVYEALDYSGTADWALGVATSSDGTTWTKWSDNPVVLNAGGPWVQKVGSTYYMWVHTTTGSGNNIASDISRLSSTDLINWTLVRDTFVRETYDEGANLVRGQVADPHLMEIGGKTYMWYEGTRDSLGSSGLPNVIKWASAPYSISQLINTNEGTYGNNRGAAARGINRDINSLMNNIGINNDSPEYALDVTGTLKVNQAGGVGIYMPTGQAMRNTTVTSAGLWYIDTPNLYFRDPSNTYAPSLTLLAGGNVGVATSTPPARLTVKTTDASNITTSLLLDNANTAGKGTKIQFAQSGNVMEVGRIANFYDTSWSMRLGTIGALEALTLRASGNVGIGTTTPITALSVLGTEVTGGTPTLTLNTSAKSSASGGPEIGFYHGNQSVATIKGASGTGNSSPFLSFGVGLNTGAPTEVGRFDENGNFGIGTTSPYAKLSVGGDVVVGAATAGGTLGDLYLPKVPSQNCLGTDATGKVQAGTCTGGAGVTSYEGGFTALATSTSMTIDFCSPTYATSSIQSLGVSSSNIAVTFTNASNCKGKSFFISVYNPASGVIGSTTFAGGSGSGPVYFDGYADPGNSTVNGGTDMFKFVSTASSTNAFIGATLQSSW